MNSYDKFMENEWNEYISNNSARISEMMVETEEDKCDGMCSDCTCGELEMSRYEEFKQMIAKEELERGFISHAQERKDTPVFSGVLKYFPNALKEVAKCSKVGNDQHHPDKPLHWDMNKSKDEYDALTRHLIDHTINPVDTDGILHLTKVAWRALAGLERHLTNRL